MSSVGRLFERLKALGVLVGRLEFDRFSGGAVAKRVSNASTARQHKLSKRTYKVNGALIE